MAQGQRPVSENVLETSFLDVATNVLAIIMIVTMFALLAVKTETAVPHDPRFREEPAYTLRTQPPQVERPFLDYYFVLEGGIVRWGQERYVDRLVAEGLRDTIHLPQGSLRISPLMAPRDPDSFIASFAPDFSVLADLAKPLTQETVGTVVAGMLERWENDRLAPNFVVYPSGMDAFTKLYRDLREEPIWLRWFLWSKEKPVRIERSSKHFARFEFDF